LPTVLQIEDHWGDDANPYYHTPGDTMAHMNLDYWEEQIKATLVTAAHLAVPVMHGFTLTATPPSRAIATGGVATFTLGVQPSGGFTRTVDLVATSPSPSLTLELYPHVVDPPGEAILAVTDTHSATFVSHLWYTVQITATGGGITQTTSVSLTLEGVRVYLPIVLRERLFPEESYLGPRVQDDGRRAIPFSHFRDCVPQQRPANRALWGSLLRKHLMPVSKRGQIFNMRFPTYRQDERLYEHLSAAERR